MAGHTSSIYKTDRSKKRKFDELRENKQLPPQIEKAWQEVLLPCMLNVQPSSEECHFNAMIVGHEKERKSRIESKTGCDQPHELLQDSKEKWQAVSRHGVGHARALTMCGGVAGLQDLNCNAACNSIVRDLFLEL
eukprot:5748497-Amphidinium_carterae.1